MKIAVLASGGDGPGMNDCIHYLTKELTSYGKNKVFASLYGFQGLINNNFVELKVKETKKHKGKAGVFIKSSRCLEFMTEKGQQKAVENLKKQNIDVLVILGGEGSYKGAITLMKKGVKVIFVPATIDRDLVYDTYSIGFYTAVSACCHYIHNVKPTMDAFDRVCVYEIMGRDNSSLSKLVGDIVDADLIITKENINNIDYKAFAEMHKQNPVRTVILQERLVPINDIVEKIEEVTGGGVRQCVIGYVQRGTAPTKDEIKKSKQFACLVKKAINKNKFGCAVAIDDVGGKIIKLF